MKSTAVDESLSSMNQQFSSRENQLLQKEERTIIETEKVMLTFWKTFQQRIHRQNKPKVAKPF